MNKELANIRKKPFPLTQSKVDKSRLTFPLTLPHYVKTKVIPLWSPPTFSSVLNFLDTKFFDTPASCLEQKRTELSVRLFEIQIIGLEQDWPLQKEALWKR